MSYYESVFIARPDISTAQVEALTDSLKAIVTENGGTAKSDEYWGLKSLAYKIKKNRKGHYSMLNLDAPAAAISELERNMRLNEDILRFMTIKVDELQEEQSIMMKNKGSRDDRGRRDRDDRPRETREAAAPKAESETAESAPETEKEGDDK